MMRNIKVLAAVIFTFCVSFSATYGEAVMDPQQWLAKFNETVQQGKQEEIRKIVVGLPTRAASRDVIIQVIDLMATVQRGRTPTGVSTVQINRLGDLIFRGIMMANFEDDKPVFVLFDFLKSGNGWVLTDLSLNTNLNPLLTWPWPYH